MDNCENRIKKAVKTLKELNHLKKKQDKSFGILTEKIAKLRPKIENQVIGLEQTLYAYLEWARFQPGDSRIDIRGKAYHGTIFKGVWSETTLDSDQEQFIIRERGRGPHRCEMAVD